MTVAKRSVSYVEDTFRAVQEDARQSGISTSAALNEAAELWLTRRQGLRAVADWEAEHGELTSGELQAADAILDGFQP